MADILIRGMEMPTNVFDCPLNTFGICNLAQDETHSDCIGDSRPEWCPLVPLPEEHGRLGDLDKINASLEAMIEIEHNQKATPHSWSHAYMEMQSILDDAPTIVPAEGGGEDG